ncbi:NUDIX domain-containing protein [Pedobacter sp. Du54]|uniref:NUDIX hydrolase n=1 Tax=Pedobacter anseongensis TaxID=3133439 RepID=UPI0030A59EB2
MAQKYRIYINDNTLFIGEHPPKQLEKTQPLDTENFDFPTFYKNLVKGAKKNYILEHQSPKMLFKAIKKKCTLIKAGGGLVENAKGEYLFIFRNKKWDLPKGKVEKGEKVKVAAVREVEEECGVKIEKRGKRLCKTYHIYELNAKVMLKSTSWYKMEVKGKPKLIPQKEEGITTASWVSETGIKNKIKNTYPLILEVLKTRNLF